MSYAANMVDIPDAAESGEVYSRTISTGHRIPNVSLLCGMPGRKGREASCTAISLCRQQFMIAPGHIDSNRRIRCRPTPGPIVMNPARDPYPGRIVALSTSRAGSGGDSRADSDSWTDGDIRADGGASTDALTETLSISVPVPQAIRRYAFDRPIM